MIEYKISRFKLILSKNILLLNLFLIFVKPERNKNKSKKRNFF